MKYQLLAEAEAEAEQAADWYNAQKGGIGDDFLDELTAALHRIANNPQAFPVLGSSASKEVRQYRHCVLRRFPYCVVYEILSDEIQVVAVAHAKRRPGYWSNRVP